MARHPEVLLRTMVARELGIQVEDRSGGVLRGALFMGAAFGLGALVPIVPFLLLPIAMALPAAVVATGLVLFGIGVVKSRWTHRSAMSSGLEVLASRHSPASPATCSAPSCRSLLGVAGIAADSSDPLGQVDRDRVALALVDRVPQIGLDRQLVRAVAERHERAPERMAVDRPGDLDQARACRRTRRSSRSRRRSNRPSRGSSAASR